MEQLKHEVVRPLHHNISRAPDCLFTLLLLNWSVVNNYHLTDLQICQQFKNLMRQICQQFRNLTQFPEHQLHNIEYSLTF